MQLNAARTVQVSAVTHCARYADCNLLHSYGEGVRSVKNYLAMKYEQVQLAVPCVTVVGSVCWRDAGRGGLQTRPGGKLLIRDVVGPSNGSQRCVLALANDDGRSAEVDSAEVYLKWSSACVLEIERIVPWPGCRWICRLNRSNCRGGWIVYQRQDVWRCFWQLWLRTVCDLLVDRFSCEIFAGSKVSLQEKRK